MSDAGTWLAKTQDHVATAQLVLDEVGQGLATAERVEAVAERAVPVIRAVTIILVGSAVGLGVFLLISRRQRRRKIQLESNDGSEPDQPFGG